MRIAIVGAGMAGLACAEKLVAAGREVVLLDKGRAAGGRMSTRRLATPRGEAAFDHGAQYLTARDPAFRARLERWREAGLVARWPAAGEDAWVGVPGMNAPVRAMAAPLGVRWEARVERLSRGEDGWHLGGEGIEEGPFGAVLVAVPAEQAAELLAPCDAGMAARAAATPSDPCWTAMAAFAERLPIEGDVIRDAGPIGWAARNSAKPGRAGPESWVIQAGPAWSRENLERGRDEVAGELAFMLANSCGFAPLSPISLSAHRWRYARSGAAGEGRLWDPAARLGACGDWLLGPRVECAWLSGDRLAEAVLGTPSA